LYSLSFFPSFPPFPFFLLCLCLVHFSPDPPVYSTLFRISRSFIHSVVAFQSYVPVPVICHSLWTNQYIYGCGYIQHRAKSSELSVIISFSNIKKAYKEEGEAYLGFRIASDERSVAVGFIFPDHVLLFFDRITFIEAEVEDIASDEAGDGDTSVVPY